MILSWQGHWVEFFPHPDLDPKDSWFSACIRVPEIDALYAKWSALDWDHTPGGFPNIGAPIELGGEAPRMFTIGDPDGSLWRVLEMGQPSQP